MIDITSKNELTLLRKSGEILSSTLKKVAQAVTSGITTSELDRIATESVNKQGGRPSFLGYGTAHSDGTPPFPAALCVSVNEEIVHGIPGNRELKEGDIVGLDLGVEYKGLYSDAAVTVSVGKLNPTKHKLLSVAREALRRGLAQVRPGNTTGDIGIAIQGYVEGQQLTVVRELVGHGVGKAVHEPPQIPNYGRPGEGERLVPGMCLALEPMVVKGSWEVKFLSDGWTAITKDKKPSAHFEQTVLVTKDGNEIITKDNELW